jgi:hypothetical protein
MIKCKDCGSSQLEGTLFCNECGCYLVETAVKGTTVLPFTDFARPKPPPAISKFTPKSLAESVTLTFVIPSSRRRLKIELNEQIRIGRADTNVGDYPEFDLGDDLGVEMGVSRLHATIEPSDKGLVIIDQGSTNGTFLNNAQLTPNLPYPINNGDEIRFGDLLIHILF